MLHSLWLQNGVAGLVEVDRGWILSEAGKEDGELCSLGDGSGLGSEVEERYCCL